MNRIKNILTLITVTIGAFLMLIIQSKNRKIEKQQDEIKQHKSKNEELSYINKQNQEAKHEKNTINSNSESDVNQLLNETKSYRDCINLLGGINN